MKRTRRMDHLMIDFRTRQTTFCTVQIQKGPHFFETKTIVFVLSVVVVVFVFVLLFLPFVAMMMIMIMMTCK